MARAVARPPMPPPTIAIFIGSSSRSEARSCAIFVAGAMSGRYRQGMLDRPGWSARKIAILIPDRVLHEVQLPPVLEAGRRSRLELHVIGVTEHGGYEGAFDAIGKIGAGALLVMSSPDFARDRNLIKEVMPLVRSVKWSRVLKFWHRPIIRAAAALRRRQSGRLVGGARQQLRPIGRPQN